VIIPAVFTSPGPVLFQLGPITLRWYGLLIALAVLIGLNLSSWLAKQRNLESGLISDLLPILVLASIIGARFIMWPLNGAPTKTLGGMCLRYGKGELRSMEH